MERRKKKKKNEGETMVMKVPTAIKVTTAANGCWNAPPSKSALLNIQAPTRGLVSPRADIDRAGASRKHAAILQIYQQRLAASDFIVMRWDVSRLE